MATISSLLTAGAVRGRAHVLLDLGLEGQLDHFAIDMAKLPSVADYVLDTMRAAYPDLAVPFHSRWRHFEAGDIDRWGGLMEAVGSSDPYAFGRAACDLAIVSVLLDAGAGPDWSYREAATGRIFSRSEGLAVASFAGFTSGLFSADPADPLRADAPALAAITANDLALMFQVTVENPMVGLEGRAALLNALGRVVADRADLFGKDEARPGGLYDAMLAAATPRAGDGADEVGIVAAPRILEIVLQALGPIWPSRITVDGIALGDTWRHGKLATGDATDRLMPFHKLSQWLSYSLIEPLLWTGVEVSEIDGLTGLPEYRNGGLFLDMGLLVPRDPAAFEKSWKVDDEFIVEWRALTVALLDHVAEAIRDRLELSADEMPLARILQGGTWSAGRRIAREKRADGGPPLKIESDGTVF